MCVLLFKLFKCRNFQKKKDLFQLALLISLRINHIWK